jgi:hypothetical protein
MARLLRVYLEKKTHKTIHASNGIPARDPNVGEISYKELMYILHMQAWHVSFPQIYGPIYAINAKILILYTNIRTFSSVTLNIF